MSRDDGFDVADVATGLYDDPKIKALWRALGHQGRMGHALALHMATLLASWRHGCRVTVLEAVPVWLDADTELIASLQSVRLLDKAGKIPRHAWRKWFDRAVERRLRGREMRAESRARRASAPRCDHPDCLRQGRLRLAWERNPHVCYLCGVAVVRGVNLHMDHVVPLALGGAHCADNLKPSCPTCNMRKGARP